MVYLLYTTSFVTLEEVKNFKSLQSYKYFTAGWVIDHRWKIFNEVCLIVGKVNHSYAMSSAPLNPWVIIKNSGTVVCGHCTCMAGLGETCSHIGALLYWIEYAVRKQDEGSCTSRANKWMEPRTTKQVPYLQLDTIDFTSSEKRMKLYQHGKSTTTNATTTATIAATTTAAAITADTDVQEFFDKCLTSSSLPVLFSVLDEPYCKSFAKAADHLPVPLQSIFDPEHLQCTYLELLEAGEQMKGLLEITSTQQKHLEETTKGQSKSNVWSRFRSGRVTASRFHQVVHTNIYKPALSLVQNICYPESAKFSTEATQYGCGNENRAIEAYKAKMAQEHEELKIIPAGLVLYVKNACFGASPDSFIECKCCGAGVLEVKCPFTAKDSSVTACAEKSTFCLQRNSNGSLSLKLEHPYYYQCQLQLLVTERSFCDFVVWAPAGDIHIERLTVDHQFLEPRLRKAEKFFQIAIIPELLGKWYSRESSLCIPCIENITDCDEEDSGKWCYCQEPLGGAMIGCDNPSCPIKWFHKSCLRMDSDPEGKWICPTCHRLST